MVQMTKTEVQAQINRLLVNNTSGDIEADEVNDLLTDLSDSVTFIAPTQAPSIRTFLISNQPTSVDPGTTLTGLKTFIYTVANSDDVVGNLTLSQGGANLSTTVDPKGISLEITINDITLSAAQSITFTLSGTDVGANPFSADFVVTARQIDEFVYYGTQVANTPATFDFANESRTPFVSGTQQITIPSFTGNEYLIIAQIATEPDFTIISIDGINQINAFTKTPSAFQVNGKAYDAWTSDHALIGSVVTGDVITLER